MTGAWTWLELSVPNTGAALGASSQALPVLLKPCCKPNTLNLKQNITTKNKTKPQNVNKTQKHLLQTKPVEAGKNEIKGNLESDL